MNQKPNILQQNSNIHEIIKAEVMHSKQLGFSSNKLKTHRNTFHQLNWLEN